MYTNKLYDITFFRLILRLFVVGWVGGRLIWVAGGILLRWRLLLLHCHPSRLHDCPLACLTLCKTQDGEGLLKLPFERVFKLGRTCRICLLNIHQLELCPTYTDGYNLLIHSTKVLSDTLCTSAGYFEKGYMRLNSTIILFFCA